jgi:uncharacterized small protein (DUF1192 family)
MTAERERITGIITKLTAELKSLEAGYNELDKARAPYESAIINGEPTDTKSLVEIERRLAAINIEIKQTQAELLDSREALDDIREMAGEI